MKLEFVSMYPKDNYDEIITVNSIPRWYEKLDIISKPAEETTIRYWGSGHQWWEEASDRRADAWTSAILYDYWHDALNKRIERKNCKYE